MKATSLEGPGNYSLSDRHDRQTNRPLLIGALALLLVGFLAGIAVGYRWGKGNPVLQSQLTTAQPAMTVPPERGLRDEVVNYAITFLGTPYRPRGQGNDGFDCSGYIAHVFKNFAIDLPPSTQYMIKEGEEVPEKEAKPGDLIFFTGTSEDSQEVGHAGIVVQNKGDDIKFIHSSSGSKAPYVKFDSLAKAGYRRRFMVVKRILQE
jgi:cell wall-associated NlpC family hydrolase